MTRPRDEELLAFLEGTLDVADRERVLTALEADPALAVELRHAALGLEFLQAVPPEASPPVERARTRRISPWWAVAAAAASVAIAVPTTLRLGAAADASGATETLVTGRPVDPESSFVLVLHGLWPDAERVDAPETRRRAAEYWAWTSDLAARGVLMAAGDLRWEPGARIDSEGAPLAVAPVTQQGPDFLVGMFALRASSYEEALALARECPHLRYGGSVSVRQVAGGFVTVPGMGDWEEAES